MASNNLGELREVLAYGRECDEAGNLRNVLENEHVKKWLAEDCHDRTATSVGRAAVQALVDQNSNIVIPPPANTVDDVFSNLTVQDDVINWAFTERTHRAIDSLGDWLRKNTTSTLQTVLRDASGTKVNADIKAWLDLPKSENGYAWHNHTPGPGWDAIRLLHEYFNKPLARLEMYRGNTVTRP